MVTSMGALKTFYSRRPEGVFGFPRSADICIEIKATQFEQSGRQNNVCVEDLADTV